MCGHFIKRGYPVDTLLDAINKVSQKTREELLEMERKKWVDSDDIRAEPPQDLFLITAYTPEYTGLQSNVRENWDLLKRSSTTKILAKNREMTRVVW